VGGRQPGGGGGTERTAIELPERIRMRRIGPDESLSGLMAFGGIDAMITPRAPSGFLKGDGSVRRLFPDFMAAEAAYYRKTGFFPIMHCIALRRSLAEEHPWLPRAIYGAFATAKASALEDLQKINFLRVALPWIATHYEDTRQLLQDDYWAYGFEQNRREIEAMLGYARADGLLTGAITGRDLFHHSLLET
jgi:4,5-dihydroxyphthalate decarboxylase